MGKADLHIHTRHGDGLDSVERIFEHVEAKADLDVIAITEHDSLETALDAREAWARGNFTFDFVPGVEVTTLEGHVVAHEGEHAARVEGELFRLDGDVEGATIQS